MDNGQIDFGVALGCNHPGRVKTAHDWMTELMVQGAGLAARIIKYQVTKKHGPPVSVVDAFAEQQAFAVRLLGVPGCIGAILLTWCVPLKKGEPHGMATIEDRETVNVLLRAACPSCEHTPGKCGSTECAANQRGNA